MGMGHVIFGNHQGARSIFVQSVDDAGPQFTANSPQIRAVIKQAIDQRTAVVSRRRMHHQPRLLVDHNNVIVFIQNIEGNGFSLEFYRNRRRYDT